MSEITFERYLCGEPHTAASTALSEWLSTVETDRSYLPVMQHRVAGKLADICKDIYYIAMQDGKPVSRHWNGWGRHENAVGNFGNFLTLDHLRGQGIGKKMLEIWYEDLMQQQDRPLGLFCSASTQRLVEVYGEYGFVRALSRPTSTRLYMPLDDSPKSFAELCEDYFCQAKQLRIQPATFEWRHEIDCLLQFAFNEMNEPFGLPGCGSLEEALIWPGKGSADILLTEKNRPVGWSFTPAGGEKTWQIHPAYRKQFAESVL